MLKLNPFTSLLLFVVVLSTLFSCDNGSRGKTPVDTLYFVESSSGLPTERQWRHAISFYDINGDGHLDILAPPPRKASKADQRPYIWLGNGKGEWSSMTPVVPDTMRYDYGGIVGGDFNNDGIPDIALAMHENSLKGLKGLGNGNYADFSNGFPSNEVFTARGITSADFNNDGIADIAAVSEAMFKKDYLGVRDGITVCLGGSSGWRCRFIGDRAQTQRLFADKIVTGDVNADGNVDIGIASLQHNKDLIVWVGDGKGDFVPFNKGLMTKSHYPSVAFSDLNGDGRDDLIASTYELKTDTGFLKAYLSEKGGFKDASDGLPDDEEVYQGVSAGDLDGDGVPEIVAGTGTGVIEVFSQKDGKWMKMKTVGLPKTVIWRLYNTYCVDVNQDGLDDIAYNYATEKK